MRATQPPLMTCTDCILHHAVMGSPGKFKFATAKEPSEAIHASRVSEVASNGLSLRVPFITVHGYVHCPQVFYQRLCARAVVAYEPFLVFCDMTWV